MLANPQLISLAAGFVDNATLPIEATARASADLLTRPNDGRRALQYGSNQGDDELRGLLAGMLEETENLPHNALESLQDRIVLTQGSQQMLYLLAEALLDPGDIVLVEAPTYFVFLDVVRLRGAEALGMECDEGGMRTESLEATLLGLESEGKLDKVKLIYLVSEHNNPTGLSLAENRRRPIVELARRFSRDHRILILEDAAYRGLCFDSAEPRSVWSEDDGQDLVIHCRTFSKTFSPGLRCGYSVLPEDLIEPLLAIKGSHDFGSAHYIQSLLAQLIANGSYNRHLAGLRTSYRSKRDALLRALEAHFGGFGEAISWTIPAGGIYVWMTFPNDFDASRGSAFFERCVELGVLYVPGDLAFPSAPREAPRNHARLTFGVPSSAELAEGARRLAKAFAETMAMSTS